MQCPNGNTFIAVVLNETGAAAFPLALGLAPGVRLPFFVWDVPSRSDHLAVETLVGLFLADVTARPAAFNDLTGSASRLYFPRDRRVASYDALTAAEIAAARDLLKKTGRMHPAARSLSRYLPRD